MRVLYAVLFALTLLSCNQQIQVIHHALNDSVFWQINPDASFSLHSGSIIISSIQPSIDGKAVSYSKIKITGDDQQFELIYKLLPKGVMKIILRKDTNSLILSTELSGLDNAPAIVNPISNGEVKGADRFFKQGIGFAGPSGVFKIPSAPVRQDEIGIFENVWSYDSYMIFGLFAESNSSLVFASYDNTNYIQRTKFYNKHHRFGLVDRWLEEDKVLVDAGFCTEGIPLPDKKLVLPEIHFLAGQKPFVTMKKVAENIAKFNHVRLTQKSAYHWCSWYEMGNQLNEKHVFEFLDKIKKLNTDPEIQTVQIDDGYAIRGDWLNPDPKFFPSGLDTIFGEIKKTGYRSGIWVAPFMVSSRTQMHIRKPDWLLHDIEGNLIVESKSNVDTMYVLDSSNPEAFSYLRSVFRKMYLMGVRFYKTDFMDWGLRNSLKYRRFNPGKTSVQYFREVAVMIREEIGTESFWLGCISPYAPMIGLVDGMRIANDLGNSWSDYSHFNMFQESQSCQYFNNVFWQNDPDVLYLDGFKTQYSEEEKKSIILWNGMLGGAISTSDCFHLVSDTYMKWWKFIKPGHQANSAEFPYWSNQLTFRTMLHKLTPTTWTLLVLNDNHQSQTIAINLKEITGQTQLNIFEWDPTGSKYLGLKGEFKREIQKHNSVLLYLNTEKISPFSNLKHQIVP